MQQRRPVKRSNPYFIKTRSCSSWKTERIKCRTGRAETSLSLCLFVWLSVSFSTWIFFFALVSIFNHSVEACSYPGRSCILGVWILMNSFLSTCVSELKDRIYWKIFREKSVSVTASYVWIEARQNIYVTWTSERQKSLYCNRQTQPKKFQIDCCKVFMFDRTISLSK